MSPEERDLLRFDYEKVLAFIDKTDGHLFKIREWAITFTAAVVAYSVAQDRAVALLGNVIAIVGFGSLELIYKQFHDDAIQKGYRAEILLRASLDPSERLPPDYVFGVGHAIRVPSLHRILDVLRRPTRWHIGALYLGLLFLTALAAFYVQWGASVEVVRRLTSA